MALNDLLGKILLIGSLAVGGVYCGNGEGGNPCRSDADCKGERICVAGTCSGGDDDGNDGDRCGNSPFYGKHLWEISGCRLGFYARKDCSMGMNGGKGDTGGKYIFVWPEGSEKPEAVGKPMLTYGGLQITIYKYGIDGQTTNFTRFDPTVRFTSSSPGADRVQSVEKLNTILNNNRGMVLVETIKHYEDGRVRVNDSYEGDQIKLDDNAYIAIDTPYPSYEGCKASSYYVGKF